MSVSDARPGRARHASVRLIAGHSPVRSVRCAPVRVLGVQQSPPCVGPATGLVQPIRLSTDYMHSRAQALLGSRAQALPGSRAQALPWYPCSPRGASEGGGAARRAGGPSSATHLLYKTSGRQKMKKSTAVVRVVPLLSRCCPAVVRVVPLLFPLLSRCCQSFEIVAMALVVVVGILSA